MCWRQTVSDRMRHPGGLERGAHPVRIAKRLHQIHVMIVNHTDKRPVVRIRRVNVVPGFVNARALTFNAVRTVITLKV